MIYLYSAILVSLLLSAPFAKTWRVDKLLFVAYGILMSAVCLFKPFGVSPDDLNYKELLGEHCWNFSCFQKGELSRDFLWFSLVSLVNVFDGFFAIKLVSVFSLIVKLFVIFKLTKRRIVALTVYVALFYFLHDLTQYRVSLAIGFYMLAIYFLTIPKTAYSLIPLTLSFFTHVQALFSVFMLASQVKHFRPKSHLYIFALLIALTVFGFSPNVGDFTYLWQYASGEQYDSSSAFGRYIYLAEEGEYLKFRAVPLTGILLFISLLYLKTDSDEYINGFRSKNILQVSFFSLTIAFLSIWAFPAIPDMQNRFYEFFALPIVFIFGNMRSCRWNYAILYSVCIAYFLKYHILSGFFYDIKGF